MYDAPPDLVLLDIMMPGINGIDVLRVVRSDARLRSMPVVAYTAAEDPAYRTDAMPWEWWISVLRGRLNGQCSRTTLIAGYRGRRLERDAKSARSRPVAQPVLILA